MKRYNWQISLGISLIILSAIVYLTHYLIFEDPHHIFIYLIGDIAFVFIEVLLVTLVIHSLLNMKEKKKRLEKLNMLIGTFFSELGTRLLVYFSDSDPKLEKIKEDLIIEADWSDVEFIKVSSKLKAYKYDINIKKIDLLILREYLLEKNDFLVRLLENPNLLEHETFTELLRAVFHLDEELRSRKNLKNLSENDLKHITGDIKRAYRKKAFQTDMSSSQKEALLDEYTVLPTFPEVNTGLQNLKKSGHRLFAFSNGSKKAVSKLLTVAKIIDHFDGIVSVEDVSTFKPNPLVYSHFNTKTNSTKSDSWLISSNPFDVIGAISYGMRSAWIQRSEDLIFDPWGVEPTIVVSGISDLSLKL